MQGKETIKFIHYLRAIAAISVVYGHWGTMFFLYPDVCDALALCQNFSRGPIPWIIKATGWNNFSFGQFGVGIFFLISGFLTAISWRHKTIGQFIAKRALRLYPLYSVGLLFTGGVLFLSAKWNSIPFPYTFEIYLKNLSLFRLWFWVPGMDGVVWTMEVDVFFYLVCIFLVYYGYKLDDAHVWVALSMVGSLMIYLTHEISLDWIASKFYLYKFFYCVNHFFSYLPIIFIGMTFWNATEGQWNVKKSVAYIFFFYLLFCFNYSVLDAMRYKSYWLSYACSIAVFIAGFRTRHFFENTYYRLLQYIGDISFPLYIVHGAAGYAVLAWLYKQGFGLWSFLVAGGLFLGISHLLHIYVESKSEILAKKWVKEIHGF